MSGVCIILVNILTRLSGPEVLSHGPFVGHVTTDGVCIWARASAAGDFELHVREVGGEWASSASQASEATDLCMTLTATGLEAGTAYEYSVTVAGAAPVDGAMASFATAPPADAPTQVDIVFGSCANGSAGAMAVWDRVAAVDPDAVVLLGDTPYIDTTNLATQREQYREFASIASMRNALRSRSWYGTWDDHDFGKNDTDGNLPGKENSRQAFVEYHAQDGYGDGTEGIYTSFRRGPVEVFLLDTRYFAATGPSPAGGDHPTLLGPSQWRWLQRSLVESDATFKVLASGMIWNKAVRPFKKDMWATYRHERDALFRFIGEAGITGVVLVGGDIHRSRVVRHAVADLAGYDLTELITSPMHDRIIGMANAPHPGLVWDAGAPNSFLLLTADTTVEPATLTAQFLNAEGTVLHTEVMQPNR